MKKLAIVLRFGHLYAHMAHNLCSGSNFFADHEFLGDLYLQYEKDFDAVVERMIGAKNKPDIIELNKEAIKLLASAPFVSATEAFNVLMTIEKKICKIVEEICWPQPMTHPHGGPDPATQGEIQLLGNICDLSEVRQYKIKQRLGI